MSFLSESLFNRPNHRSYSVFVMMGMNGNAAWNGGAVRVNLQTSTRPQRGRWVVGWSFLLSLYAESASMPQYNVPHQGAGQPASGDCGVRPCGSAALDQLHGSAGSTTSRAHSLCLCPVHTMVQMVDEVGGDISASVHGVEPTSNQNGEPMQSLWKELSNL